MSVRRPRRARYASEPDYLIACLRYLDAKFPGREGQRARLAAFERWEREHNPEHFMPRLRELVMLDRPFTVDETAEFEALIVAYHEHRKSTSQEGTRHV